MSTCDRFGRWTNPRSKLIPPFTRSLVTFSEFLVSFVTVAKAFLAMAGTLLPNFAINRSKFTGSADAILKFSMRRTRKISTRSAQAGKPPTLTPTPHPPPWEWVLASEVSYGFSATFKENHRQKKNSLRTRTKTLQTMPWMHDLAIGFRPSRTLAHADICLCLQCYISLQWAFKFISWQHHHRLSS